QRRSRIARLTTIPAPSRRTLAQSTTQPGKASSTSPNEMIIVPISAGTPNCGAISTCATPGVMPCESVYDHDTIRSRPGKPRRPWRGMGKFGIRSSELSVVSGQLFVNGAPSTQWQGDKEEKQQGDLTDREPRNTRKTRNCIVDRASHGSRSSPSLR